MALRTAHPPPPSSWLLAVVTGLGIVTVAAGPVAARPAAGPHAPSRPPPPSTGCSARGPSPTATRWPAPVPPSTTASTACCTSPPPRPRPTAIAELGFRLEAAAAAARRRARRRRRRHAGLPAGRLELPRLRRADRRASTRSSPTTRRSPARSASARRTRAATCRSMKISDNVGTDENEPEILFNSQQHAREHLTVEMAIYLLNLFTDSYGTRLPDHQHRQQPGDLDRADGQPGRQRVRHRHRLVPVLAQEPAAQQRLVERRHRPEPQLGLQLGLLRRLVRHHLVGDLPGPVGVLRAGDAGAAQLRQQPGGRRRAADQGEHRLPHVLAAGALAVRLHHGEHRDRD